MRQQKIPVGRGRGARGCLSPSLFPVILNEAKNLAGIVLSTVHAEPVEVFLASTLAP